MYWLCFVTIFFYLNLLLFIILGVGWFCRGLGFRVPLVGVRGIDCLFWCIVLIVFLSILNLLLSLIVWVALLFWGGLRSRVGRLVVCGVFWCTLDVRFRCFFSVCDNFVADRG